MRAGAAAGPQSASTVYRSCIEHLIDPERTREWKGETMREYEMHGEVAEIYQKITALVPEVRQQAVATEQSRRISEDMIGKIKQTGAFKILQPKKFGGLEGRFSDLVRLNVALAKGCGSTAWCMSLGAIHNWIVALFPETVQAEIWDDTDNIVAGSYMPVGKCERVTDGYQISGEWAFASNCDNSQWFLVGAMIPPDTKTEAPRHGLFLLPRHKIEIVDTWFSTGMSGTGSKSISVKESVFVPDTHMLTMAQINSTQAPGTAVHSNPMYRLTFSGVAPSMLISPAIGIAVGAVSDFEDIARTKAAAQPGGPPVPMSSLAHVQVAVAKASSCADWAQAMVLADLAELEAALERQILPDTDQRIRHRRNHTFAGELITDGVNSLFAALGANGGALSNPVQRAWRDVNVAVRHISLHWPATAAMYGQHRLGLVPKGTY